MGKALPFPQHRHPPSTLDPAFKIRIGALSNDQGTEAPAPEDGEPSEEGPTPESQDETAPPEEPVTEWSVGE